MEKEEEERASSSIGIGFRNFKNSRDFEIIYHRELSSHITLPSAGWLWALAAHPTRGRVYIPFQMPPRDSARTQKKLLEVNVRK